MRLRNETTLVLGVLGVGKSTLAAHAVKFYDKAVVITSFAEDFKDCRFVRKAARINPNGKTVFVSDDFIENEIAMRYAYELENRLLVIDEAHLYQNSKQVKKIIRYSRHKRLDVVLVSHSFFDFARLNRHLISNVICMRMTDEKGRGDTYELNYLEAMSPETKIREIKAHQFAIIKGDLPKWIKESDVTQSGEFFQLKRG